MAWQTLHISRAGKLSLKHRNLLIQQSGDTYEIALEDLCCIVVDTGELTFTSALLSRFCELGTVVVFPDQKHLPAGLLLSFHQHYAQSEIGYLQVDASEPLKKRLWQQIIRSKIQNQCEVLSRFDEKSANTLKRCIPDVRSGDDTNVESYAARFYFQNLFLDFNRQNEDDFRNALLNYGYAIVRAALARSVVAYGLLPAFGIHHKSKHNPFNLVDDLIEPYRAFVDWVVCERMATINEFDDLPSDLAPEDKRFMTQILIKNIELDGKILTLAASTDLVVASFVRDLRRSQVHELGILLPRFLVTPLVS